MFLAVVFLVFVSAQPGSIDPMHGSAGLLLLPADLVDEISANLVLDDFSILYVNTKFRPSFAFPGLSEKVIELVASGNTSYSVTLNGVFPIIETRPYYAEVGFARLFPGGNVLLGGHVSSPSASFESAFVMLVNQKTARPILSFGVNGTVYVGQGLVTSAVFQSQSVLLLKRHSQDQSLPTNQWSSRISYSGVIDNTWDSAMLPLDGPVTSVPQVDAQCGFALANNVTLVIGTLQSYIVASEFNSTTNTTRYSSIQNYSIIATLFQNDVRIAVQLFKFSFANGTDVSSSAESCVRVSSGSIVVAGLGSRLHFAALKLSVVNLSMTIQENSFVGGLGASGSSILPITSPKSSPVSLQAYVFPTDHVVLCGVVGTLPFGMQCARLLPNGQIDSNWLQTPLAPPVPLQFPFLNSGLVTRNGRLLLTGRALTPAIQAFSLALLAEASATPCDLGPQCLCVGVSCSTQGDFVGSGGLVNGSAVVNGNFVGLGVVTIQPSPFGAGYVSVGGVAYAAGGTLVVQVNQSGTFPVISASGGILGSFDHVNAVVPGLDECFVADAVATTSADSSTLSVIVSIRRDQACWTRAQIAGISIGTIAAVAVGVALVFGIVVFTKRQQFIFTTKRREELRQEELVRNMETAASPHAGPPNPTYGMDL